MPNGNEDDDDWIPCNRTDDNDRELYHDEDIETIHDSHQQSSSSSSAAASNVKMTPMSVSTGGDYHMSAAERSNNKKAALASFLSVVFVVISYFLTKEHRAKNATAAAAAAATKGHGSSLPKVFCQGLDANYFEDLMNRTAHYTMTDERLCAPKIHNRSCTCHHPFRPIPQDASPDWSDVMAMNVDYMTTTYSVVQPDVVLYGDSITEHLLGRNFGLSHKKYHATGEVTKTVLRRRNGGKINGLPMAISGDQIAHLLYRLQNGEMPSTLHPKVWWFLIGLNDARAGCSVDTIVAGNINIAQEIHNRQYSETKQHPSLTPIVVNSLLPRGSSNLLSVTSPWRHLQEINRQLACYAAIKPDVYFVNTTDVFLTSNRTGAFLDDELYQSDHIHPSAEGTRKWLELIVDNVLRLMA